MIQERLAYSILVQVHTYINSLIRRKRTGLNQQVDRRVSTLSHQINFARSNQLARSLRKAFILLHMYQMCVILSRIYPLPPFLGASRNVRISYIYQQFFIFYFFLTFIVLYNCRRGTFEDEAVDSIKPIYVLRLYANLRTIGASQLVKLGPLNFLRRGPRAPLRILVFSSWAVSCDEC